MPRYLLFPATHIPTRSPINEAPSFHEAISRQFLISKAELQPRRNDLFLTASRLAQRFFRRPRSITAWLLPNRRPHPAAFEMRQPPYWSIPTNMKAQISTNCNLWRPKVTSAPTVSLPAGVSFFDGLA